MHIQRIVGPNDCTTMVAVILNPFHIIFLNLCYHDYFCIGLATHCATPCVLQIVNIFQHWVLNHGTVLNTARFSAICVSWGEIRLDWIQFFFLIYAGSLSSLVPLLNLNFCLWTQQYP